MGSNNMIPDNQPHYSYLKKSYDEVGKRTWQNDDFVMSSLDSSRNLFTDESLRALKPKPKNLEVYALLSGLPFGIEFSNALIAVQQNISDILDSSIHYWVLPSNFGVEYCVFKWPSDSWNDSWLPVIKQELSSLKYPSFNFTIRGIQINPDGCIIAKGYDEGVIFGIRNRLKSNLKFLPKKQSGWAHVPIGRILEPLSSSKFSKLKNMIDELSGVVLATDEIKTVKLVHETRWYMEKRSILLKFNLN
jgi:hypothetical protein